MSRKVIEIVQVLVDRIHQGGYTQRALEDDIYAESQKRVAAEKDRDHWKQARQDAHEAGELMRAEIGRLRAFVGRVRELLQIPLDQIRYDDMAIMRAELAALDAEGGA